MHVLLDDDLGRLTLRRLRPWHRMLARALAARLDRQLADGARPEANLALAARAMRLTSPEYRRDLAASLTGLLAAGRPSAAVRPLPGAARLPGSDVPQRDDALPLAASRSSGAARRPRIPVCRERISQSAAGLAGLAGRLLEPGPVPVRGVAMVSDLVTDGRGPLYRPACRDDLGAIVERAAQALAS